MIQISNLLMTLYRTWYRSFYNKLINKLDIEFDIWIIDSFLIEPLCNTPW
jgi:hypothetical protein